METQSYSVADLLTGDMATLRTAVEDPQLLKNILQRLQPSERLDLLQVSLNSCEDRFLHFALRVGNLETVKCALSFLTQQGTAVIFLVLKNQNIHHDTALHIAVQMGNIDALDCMLKIADPIDRLRLLELRDKRANKTKLNDCGNPSRTLSVNQEFAVSCSTPLHIAASLGSENLIRCILNSLESSDEQYALISMQNSIGFTAIHSAVKEEHVNCIQEMLKPLSDSQTEALLMVTDIWGSTAKHKPSKMYKPDLLSKPGSREQYGSWEIANKTLREMTIHIPSIGKTAILSAFQDDAKAITFEGIFQSWVDDCRSNPNSKRSITIPHDLGDTAVKLAFNMGSAECFQALLTLLPPGARLPFLMRMRNQQSGDTPLHVAIDGNHIRLGSCLVAVLNTDSRMKFLIERGKNGDTALHRAATGNRADTISTMLSSVNLTDRIKLLTTENQLGNTPLGIMVHRDQPDLVLSMLESLSSIENDELARLLDGMRVIHCLVKNNKLPAIRSLMMKLDHDQRTALLSQKDRQGKTAIKLASNPEIKSFFAWINEQSGSYPLATAPQVLIFHSPEITPDLEEGIQGLELAFKQLGIKPSVRSDVSEEAMILSATEVQSKSDLSGLMVIIAGRGRAGAVQTSDGVISMEKIAEQMNVPALNGKPKILAALILHKDFDAERVDSQKLMTASPPKLYSPPEVDKTEHKVPSITKYNNNVVSTRNNIYPGNKSGQPEKGLAQKHIDFLTPAPCELGGKGFDKAGLAAKYNNNLHSASANKAEWNKDTGDRPNGDFVQKYPDFASLLVHVNESANGRKRIIPTLSETLCRSADDESLEEILRKAYDTIRDDDSADTAEFSPGLRLKFRLRDVFNASEQLKSTHKSGKTGLFKKRK